MGFLKSVRKPKSLLIKGERSLKKLTSQKSRDKVKKLVQQKTPFSHDERLKSKRKRKQKMKYTGATSSTSEKSENARVYTFSLSTKDIMMDDDCFTISTISTSSASIRDTELEPQSFFICNDEIEETNLHRMRRRPSTESVLSNPLLSGESASSEKDSVINQVDERDDEANEFITNGENASDNRDEPESEELKGQILPPLLPPPRQYVSDDNVSTQTNNSLPIDIPHNPLSSEYGENTETRNKLTSVRDLRRYASEGSKDYVHVFRQPLVPLDEELSLYDSGNDADDDFSEESTKKRQGLSRRGSLSSSDDENELRQRWEFGLAMMAKMGIDTAVVDNRTTLCDENPIKKLSPLDCAFDGDEEGEI